MKLTELQKDVITSIKLLNFIQDVEIIGDPSPIRTTVVALSDFLTNISTDCDCCHEKPAKKPKKSTKKKTKRKK
jgi:hypothetical protein